MRTISNATLSIHYPSNEHNVYAPIKLFKRISLSSFLTIKIIVNYKNDYRVYTFTFSSIDNNDILLLSTIIVINIYDFHVHRGTFI